MAISIYSYNKTLDTDELILDCDSIADYSLTYPDTYFMLVGVGDARNITVSSKCILRNSAGNVESVRVAGSMTAFGGMSADIQVQTGGYLLGYSGAELDGIELLEGAHAQFFGACAKNVTARCGSVIDVYEGTVIDGLELEDGADFSVRPGTAFSLKGTISGTLALSDATVTLDGADMSNGALDMTLSSFGGRASVINQGCTGADIALSTVYDGFSFGEFALVEGTSDGIDHLELTFTDDEGEALISFECGKTLLLTGDYAAALAVRDTGSGISFTVTPSLTVELACRTGETARLEDFAVTIQIYNAPGEPEYVYARMEGVSTWLDETEMTAYNLSSGTSSLVEAVADGRGDVIFATPVGIWSGLYCAENTLTSERMSIAGMTRFGDVLRGASGDASAVLLTAGNDALFADDVFTELPCGVDSEAISRLENITLIDAGAGDDLVDMTMRHAADSNKGIAIHGGAGNDTLWGGRDGCLLFGDDGDDRVVGGSGDDVICGGAGNDALHGGGGNDIFCFGEAWGQDTVSQLSDGKVTLWFSGSQEELQLSFMAEGSDTLITAATGDSIRAVGMSLSLSDCRFDVTANESEVGRLVAARAFA